MTVQTDELIAEIDRVTKTYKNGRGIKDISFTLGKGDIFGLFGPNGAGKTTLLKIMTGLCTADSGNVSLFGCGITDRFEQAMAQVGCVIETADSYEYMSGRANLKLAGRFYRGLPEKRIDEVLEWVGLASYANERVSGYSLGMKQRLALAGALLSSPKLIVLDEPTNGLDIEGIIDVRNVILRLAETQGIAFLISSHMMSEMEMICTRVGIICGGQLIREGGVRQLLADGTTMEQFYLSSIQQWKEGNIHV
ncbi:ABC transporter ATP-binding protein [Paenibacillus nasutitermitis]|uniref:ABC transporter n=1 Tax=Paenibacillus nasutitermitis TaxID=1652958 RepID=A0A916YW76_9BACL|nr:ABC transporter ATP-binding protein [Paenibacillus nasutitermitis]GGD62461.1 ABC transporter [Paenibacillus nasutitermitis]